MCIVLESVLLANNLYHISDERCVSEYFGPTCSFRQDASSSVLPGVATAYFSGNFADITLLRVRQVGPSQSPGKRVGV